MQIYINEKFEVFEVGDRVYGNSGIYEIKKFITHHHRKRKKDTYLCVNLQNIVKSSERITLPVEFLGSFYFKQKK